MASEDGAANVEALHHVQLAMPPGGEGQARAFYQDLLGIPECPKPARLAGRGGCWFERGALRVHLGVEADFRPARKAHPAFLVSHLAALMARLEAGGHTCRSGELPTPKTCYVEDPFGNRIELIEARTDG
jgi:catechol 2,3-dioxygenase-like lactoylglutathione lyase family enzyme